MANVLENPEVEVTDDTAVPIITTLVGTEYVFVLEPDGSGGFVLKKITAANLKTYVNS